MSCTGRKKGGSVWNPRVGDPAEPLHQRALADLLFGVLTPPIEELFEHTQAQDPFYRGGVASV